MDRLDSSVLWIVENAWCICCHRGDQGLINGRSLNIYSLRFFVISFGFGGV